LPDGLTDLADHNLVSYKSIRESLTCGSMWELVSYAVLYAKRQWKKSWEAAVGDPTKLRAIAVSTHRPAWLTLGEDPALGERAAGIYEVEFLHLVIRIVVPREVVRTPRNSLWHLLSGDPDLARFGIEHYRARDAELYNILNDLRETYVVEGFEVVYTKEDYKREVARELLQKIPLEERRELIRGLPSEERRELIRGLPSEERRELLDQFPADERLRGLSAKQIEAYLKKLRKQTGRGGDAE
jgi:hypothetical protein